MIVYFNLMSLNYLLYLGYFETSITELADDVLDLLGLLMRIPPILGRRWQDLTASVLLMPWSLGVSGLLNVDAFELADNDALSDGR